MTQNVAQIIQPRPVLWDVNRDNRVLDDNAERNLTASITFIVENRLWVQENLQQRITLVLCCRLFYTIPPARVKEIMNVAKEIILQTVDPLELLIAMCPEDFCVVDVENPITQTTLTFFQINLGAWRHDSMIPLLQKGLSSRPEWGISVVGKYEMNQLRLLSKAVPQIKAFCCPGFYLASIPDNWTASMEWLFCTIVDSIDTVTSFPRLKGLIAPWALKIDLGACQALEVLEAPRVKKIALNHVLQLPEMKRDLKSLRLTNCYSIETVETHAVKLELFNLKALKSIIAPSAQEIWCHSLYDSKTLVKLHAPCAVKVWMPVDAPLAGVVLPANVEFKQPSVKIPTPMEEYLKAHLPSHMCFFSQMNSITNSVQYFLNMDDCDLDFFLDEDLESVKTVMSTYPEIGFQIKDYNFGERLDQVSRLTPGLKALEVVGSDLHKIPEEWRNSIEWLYCSSGKQKIPHLPNLKGVFISRHSTLEFDQPSPNVIVAQY